MIRSDMHTGVVCEADELFDGHGGGSELDNEFDKGRGLC